MYCCCGSRLNESAPEHCECSWSGWTDLRQTPDKLPDKDGLYRVRYCRDGDCWEAASAFSKEKKKWHSWQKNETHWSEDWWDGMAGYQCVYAWNVKESDT